MRKRLTAFIMAILLVFPLFSVRAETERPALPVLMYHHISKDKSQWNDYVVSLEEFESDLEYLASHGWHSISVRELLAWYDGEFEMPEKPFMITFDDGFESTLAYAEPLLAEYGFCGVVAVIGSVCGDVLKYEKHDPEFSNISWEEAAEMAERGVIEVQCHTWDMHTSWPRCGCRKKRGESSEAYQAALRADLEQFLRESSAHGVDLVPAIAYPFGAFSEETGEIALEEGFEVVFTCWERFNTLLRGEEKPHRLGRFNRPHGVASERFFREWETAAAPVTPCQDGSPSYPPSL